MTSLIGKYLINGFRDPAGLESWLSDMAREGLLLRKIDFQKAYFEKTVSYEMEYRIVYVKGGVPREQIERYCELGWSVACMIKDRVILAAPSEEAPTESYFGELEEKQFKSYRKNTIRSWVTVALILILQAFWDVISFHGQGIINWRDFFEGEIKFYTISIAFLVILEFGVVASWKEKNYIKNRKSMGRASHHVDWRKDRIRVYIVGALAAICTAWYIISIPLAFKDTIEMDFATAGHDRDKYPFITLTQEEDCYDEPTVEKTRSFFIENKFSLQDYSVEDEDRTLKQTYYELKSGWKKESFMKSVLVENAAEEKLLFHDAPVKWESDCFDAVYYLEIEEGTYELIASRGNKILFVEYSGLIPGNKMLKMMEGLQWEN